MLFSVRFFCGIRIFPFNNSALQLHANVRNWVPTGMGFCQSTYMQAIFKHLGTKLNISTSYHPQTDGQSERANRTIEEMLRHFVHPLHE